MKTTRFASILPVAALAAALFAACSTQTGPEPINPYESGASSGPAAGGGGDIGSGSSSSGGMGGAM